MYPTFLLCSRATASGPWHEARDRRGLEQARSSQPEPELGRLPLGASSVRRRTSRRPGRHVDGEQAPTLNGTLRRRRLPVRASWHGLGQCSCQSRCPRLEYPGRCSSGKWPGGSAAWPRVCCPSATQTSAALPLASHATALHTDSELPSSTQGSRTGTSSLHRNFDSSV